MSISDFYKNPTANAQAKLLGGRAVSSPMPEKAPVSPIVDAEPAKADIPEDMPEEKSGNPVSVDMPAPEILPPRRVPVGRPIEGHPECALVTGATGYFGAHLVRSLLKKGTKRIYCLVRGDGSRLTENLAWYFGAGWAEGVCDRVKPVSGDITKPRMGLSETDYERLAGEIRAVYHAAADVRHFVSDEEAFLKCNTGGTEAAIEIALQANAVLYYASTLSVGGEYLESDPLLRCEFSEQDCDMGQNWRDNIYVRSKMLSEALIYHAMENRGLNARILRLGRIMERSTDGLFQRNPENSMSWMVMQGMSILGAISEDIANLPMDMTPVDYAADAAAALSACDMTCAHISHPVKKPLGALIREKAKHVKIVSPEVFDRMLDEHLSRPAPESSVALLGEWVHFNRLHPASVTPVNRLTLEALEDAGMVVSPVREKPARRQTVILKKSRGHR